ncbi:MAG: helix-turn-helix transcriptional regulator [Synergistaceae bacterium]|nr:helix-turn-helix transcriptional regulator [Synergistaceae bacterium]
MKHLSSLKAEREARGLTQRGIALAVGISERSWRKYERGDVVPILERFLRIAEYLEWNMQDNPNYVYYKLLQKGQIKKWLKSQRNRYGYELKELSSELGISKTSLESVLYERKEGSLINFCKLYEMFKEEERREKIRQKILRK